MKTKNTNQTLDYSVAAFRDTANALHAGFHEKMEKYGPNLFRVDHVKHLSSGYLVTFGSEVERKEHDCTACREFMRQWGNLVFITPQGALIPAYWDRDLPTPGYQRAIAYLEDRLDGAQVTGVAYSESNNLGHLETNGLPHFGIVLDAGNVRVPKGSLSTALALEAKKGEDFKNLQRALKEYDTVYLEQVLHLLKTEKLNDAERFKPAVEFLIDAKLQLGNTTDRKSKQSRSNILWRIVAGANSALCSPRSTVIGELLDDLIKGVDVNVAVRDFNERTRSEKYMRATAAPTSGNVARAETLIDQLGLAPSLERRWAALSEVKTVWQPKATEAAKPQGGVFGHLVTKDQKPQAKELPTQKGGEISWAKFARTVLPDATKIEVYVGSGRHALGAMVTAVHDKAPPLVRWDKEGARNPVSFYVHTQGQQARVFGLIESEFNEVVGIAQMPWQWEAGVFPGDGVLFVFDGCQDSIDDGLAIFAADLRPELHEIRSTIEAFSNEGKLTHVSEQEAAGLHFYGRNGQSLRVRVTTKIGRALYILDRME